MWCDIHWILFIDVHKVLFKRVKLDLSGSAAFRSFFNLSNFEEFRDSNLDPINKTIVRFNFKV